MPESQEPKRVKPVKPIVYPEVDPNLLERVREIYRLYTGQQFADAVGEIRRDIEAGRFTDFKSN